MPKRPRPPADLCQVWRSRALAVALVAIAALGCRERAPAETEPAVALPQQPAESVRIVRPSAPGSFVDLVAKLEPSVVHLRAPESVSGGPAAVIPNASAGGHPSARRALGSGFVFDTEGHILTNHHVLGNTTEVTVVFADGQEHAAEIVGRDPKLDLALLQMKPLPSLVPVRPGSSDTLQRGEWIAVFGNPFGAEATISAGVVSSLGHLSHEAFTQPELNYLGFIQTDARIDATNSGGPVVNTAGEVVAIASASQELGGEVGYAIPISRAQAIVPHLKKNGVVSRSYIGIYVDQVSPADAKRLKLDEPRGALVTDVVDASPAARAGLRPDDVIVSVGGKPVDHTSLPWAVANAVPGTELDVGLVRRGAKSRVVVTTTELK